MRRLAGITLIEVMAVTAIVAVLLALLLPALASSKMAAKQTASSENLRNLYVATSLYREDSSYTVEYGAPSDMGLPLLESADVILQKIAGTSPFSQSPCGRHPGLGPAVWHPEVGKWAVDRPTIYYEPDAPPYFAAAAKKFEGNCPLWVDPNCSPASTPIKLAFGDKTILGVMLDGHLVKSHRNDAPFWDINYFQNR